MVWFYVSFMFIGSMFLTNLFVGVVVEAYSEEKEKIEKNDLLTTM